MTRDPSRTLPVLAVIMVGLGALLSSFVTFMSMLWGLPNMPRTFVLQDPIGWALRPGANPLYLGGMLLALALLLAAVWLFVRLVVRGAQPGRASAVFFGTWGAIIIAGLIGSTARAPLMLIAMRIPAENTDLVYIQFFQMSTIGATWGLTWGWLTATVVALLYRAATRSAALGAVGYPVAAPAQHAQPSTGYVPYPPAAPRPDGI